MRRALLGATALVAAAVVLALCVLLIGGLFDWPSKTETNRIEVAASREEVWDVLTGFDTYGQWNPVIRSVGGEAGHRARLELDLAWPDGSTETVGARVIAFRPDDAIELEMRFLSVPNLRDREYKVELVRLGPHRTLVVQHARVEGLLAPFSAVGPIGEDLAGIGESLKARVESLARNEVSA